MSSTVIALLAYLIDKKFGEFGFIRHPIILIGQLITWFEIRFYKDSIIRGLFLVIFMLAVTAGVSMLTLAILQQLPIYLMITLSALIASMFLAHTMLYDSVITLLTTSEKKAALSMLVSRDTAALSESEIYKAGIETYAENLSDGVIAPLFYLLLAGLPGIVIYKTVNTLDSMVGYKNLRYEQFGKAAARLDDLLNFIPARLTALMIITLSKTKRKFWDNKHESPNAGQSITAMALVLDVSLGGPTSYEGKIKDKPYFGLGPKTIEAVHLQQALGYRYYFDRFIISTLITILLIQGLL